jgi:hypothetical protein
MIIVNKDTRQPCWEADGCVACAQSTDEAPYAFAWAFSPMNLPGTGDSLADHELYDELPLLNEEAHELKQALHHLRRIATSANSPWLRITAHIAYECIRKVLIMFGIWVG